MDHTHIHFLHVDIKYAYLKQQQSPALSVSGHLYVYLKQKGQSLRGSNKLGHKRRTLVNFQNCKIKLSRAAPVILCLYRRTFFRRRTQSSFYLKTRLRHELPVLQRYYSEMQFGCSNGKALSDAMRNETAEI